MSDLQSVTNFLDVKHGDTLLLIDHDGKIRGFDKINHIDESSYIYKALLVEGNPYYNGDLKKTFQQYKVYRTPEIFADLYNEKKFHSAVLSWDYTYVFEILYGSESGKLMWSLMIKLAQKDFKTRIQFIDLTNKYSKVLHKLIFDDTKDQVSESEKLALKQEIHLIVNSF